MIKKHSFSATTKAFLKRQTAGDLIAPFTFVDLPTLTPKNPTPVDCVTQGN
jgi:hypothetical protein